MQDFLLEHKLPKEFINLVDRWFEPLSNQLAQYRLEAGRPLLVGINGSQGSGKSTLASLLSLLLRSIHGLKTIDLSIDDFYLTRSQRQSLAERIHPLLATRGVPGTHDMNLMASTLNELCSDGATVAIPRFDKFTDDRQPRALWECVDPPLDLVIVEGWCLGTPAEHEERLITPVNELERTADPDGVWRRYVNQRIDAAYSEVYAAFDVWIMLQAPSFEAVYQWRLEQEQKLSDKQSDQQDRANRVMSADQIALFIQHFQRLTEQALRTLPQRVHYLYRMDTERLIVEAIQPRPVALV